jgi:pimeloyl-ACP methyl ester carboxylesterase
MRVDIGGGTRLFFDVAGSGLAAGPEMVKKPTLLLLHGGPGGDHSLFRPYFDRFADTHQVVYYDHRGQGRSDERRDPTGWTLDTWADDVVRLCDALDVEHPVVFGQSFGGIVAMHYAARHPHHPSRLVLSSGAPRRDLPGMLDVFERLGGIEARRAAEMMWEGGTDAPTLLAYGEQCLPLYNTRSDPATAGELRTRANYRVLAHWLQGENLTFDLRPELARINCPTLVLGGTDDPVHPESVFRETVDALSQAQVDVTARLFSDCGHGSYRDHPDETERILRDWMAAT